MSTLLIVAGAVMAILGVVLIPLPGPGYPLLVLGGILLLAGLVIRTTLKRTPRQTS